MRKIVTSESVNCGHPDKTCDIIADAFLDEALRQDKNSQMAVECAIKDDLLMIYGEATTKAKLDYEKIAADILLDIGYMNQFKFIKTISQQSA
ncbi:MAG: S-adenosylmethionine synthetase N-terminal domain-containing protein, partial [Firmicutes bacterium]|nr:S-adenosylmethionine synthetase N-terminal domain-containing protein [Bacillota bacterium]